MRPRLLAKNKIFLLIIGISFSLIMLEMGLRLYNPFPITVKGDKIILPVNRTIVIEGSKVKKLDRVITHTKNSLGFRGPEMPSPFGKYLSIITVGGSTTECFYLSDNKTWPYLLGKKLEKAYPNAWLNNAGLDGHSTFGHKILLEDYIVKLKPKVILFLIGANDIGRDDLNEYDKDKLRNSYASWENQLTKKSEVISLLVHVSRVLKAKKTRLTHSEFDITKLEHLEISDSSIEEELKKHALKYIQGYKKRILELIQISRQYGIQPVFITQPMLYGAGKDDLTGVNLETVKLSNKQNGMLDWKILELYNIALKEVGRSTKTPVIDLASRLTKSSVYFYDNFHLTNKGAEEASEILYGELQTILKPFIEENPDKRRFD